jgi:dihydroxyacid dehydratase/phosphogluconate dehydratase
MRSDVVKKGVAKAPQRALFRALGFCDEEMDRPLVGVAVSQSDVVPGHKHLGEIAQAVCDGVRMAGGVPLRFPVIGVCDGLAMGHDGMRYSLITRELIADSIECMVWPTALTPWSLSPTETRSYRACSWPRPVSTCPRSLFPGAPCWRAGARRARP